ncbi:MULTISPECIES: hypothetical protein [Methylobacter]|jgi:hypothetical protein|uniref:hypothetical protein n=1 Tax=Methylobacter TaxID=429 RepID=UPI001FAC3FA2|nr:MULTISPECIES: hypothetical protein [Methylobacter]UOA09968.1 hypothetical protein KKZ03_06855 [Methylobacter sp. S3L5C]
MEHQGKTKLMTKVFIVGLIIAIFSYLFHPDVGQFSLMVNGAPVASPLLHFAAIPSALVIMLITGVLIVLLFLGVGMFLFMTAAFIGLLGIAIVVPFFWPILLIIFLIIALTSFNPKAKL